MSLPSSPPNRSERQWLNPRKLWMAVALVVLGSVGVILWSAIRGASWKELSQVTWNASWLWVAAACVVFRDAGYVLRLWVLSGRDLSLKRSTSSILLWELASALTPSVVGGSAVASFILNRNGLSWGKSLAVVMTTALLDELYFLVAVPVVAIAVGWSTFLPETTDWLEGSVAVIFGGGYAFMAVLASVLSTALFWAPASMKNWLVTASHWRLLNRWREPLTQFADDLYRASREVRSLTTRAWMAVAGATTLSWSARFLTLNAILMAFLVPLLENNQSISQFAVWARQLSMWTVMMVSPTPGSSGVAELALPTFLDDVMPLAMSATLWGLLVLLWRYLTYHLYLLVGGMLLPVWLAQTSSKGDKTSRNFRVS